MLPQAYPTLSSLAEHLEAIPGMDDASRALRARLCCDEKAGGLMPMQGYAYVARKEVSRKHGVPVEVCPDVTRLVPDEDFMAYCVADALGYIAFHHLRWRPGIKVGDAGEAIRALRAAIPESRWTRLDADVLRALRAALPDRKIPRVQTAAWSIVHDYMVKYTVTGKQESKNVIFCLLAIAGKEIIRELGGTDVGREAIRQILRVAYSAAHEGPVPVAPRGSPSVVRGPYRRTQPHASSFPRWETDPDAFGRTPNLREVAPGLYVGAATAVLYPPGSSWNPGETVPLNDAESGIAPGWDTILCLNWSESDLGLREALGGPPPSLRAGYGAARDWWCSSFLDGNAVPARVLDDALSLWAHREGPMLIHCRWGLSRSASVAAALLRLKFGLSRDEALERVRLPGVPLSEWPRVRTFNSAMAHVDGMLRVRSGLE